MLRMVRVRATDPAAAQSEYDRKIGSLRAPELVNEGDIASACMSMSELAQRIPDYEQRRTILARDPLASVDGFRVIIFLVMKYLFGMRVCAACPECNHGKSDI